MELEDDLGEEKGNNPEEQNFGTLAAPGKGSGQGVSDSPSYCGFKVNNTSVPPEDVEMAQVEKLRDAALASRPVKTLGSGKMLGENAKRSRLSESLNPRSCEGPSSISASSDDQWVAGYQRRMPQNFRNLVNRLGFRGSSRRLTEKRVSLQLSH